MKDRRRATPAHAARVAIAGAFIVGGALAVASQAGADPGDPDPAIVPVVAPADGPALPPPGVAPPVPEIPNPGYGSGKSGGGFLSSIKDAYNQAKDPYGLMDGSNGMAVGSAPPAGAGPAPALPPGYVSLNAPGSETIAPAIATGPAQGGPALPPGYYPITGAPPPGYDQPAEAVSPTP